MLNKNIMIIPPKTTEKKFIPKVAAYCRVSSETDEQHLSFESQIKYYTDYITSNPEGILPVSMLRK